ncbi:NADPH-dependent FMN reductase [Cognatilysobacter bugurensis]|uniref:FMN reductase n=1 Tax=Cognatilysobacter bugurensis TaxID=543356 RepID=A0A918W651_9GAMM|nr:NADPH-dependent FMN reductase [Lysobacter bugurensis]GHA69144.1 FMN reductase [Lysobacter bugurensis]
MPEHVIAVVVGSLRRESFNRRLADALPALFPEGFELRQVRIDDLPLYNQDDDANPPESALRLKREIREASGVIFATPEYNRSISGVLKNALDHASRPYGDSAWAGKPAGIVGVSVGQSGTACAQQHLRPILGYLDMPTLGQPEVYIQVKDDTFDADGSLGESTRTFMQGWVNRYVDWVQRHAG